jgi:hypothetical protein
MYRYFAAKSNHRNEMIYEIARRDYEKYVDNDYVVIGNLKWVIVGKLEDRTIQVYTGNPAYDYGKEPIIIPGILTQNEAAVKFLSRRIPAITSYLRKYDQFYVGE